MKSANRASTIERTDRRSDEKAGERSRFRPLLVLEALLLEIWLGSHPCSPVYAQRVDRSTETSAQVEFAWIAPVGCPDGAWVSSEIERLIGRPLEKGKEPGTRAVAKVTEIRAGRWQLRLVTLQNGKAGERELKAEACRPLAQAAALILAISIDPKAVAALGREAAQTAALAQEVTSSKRSEAEAAKAAQETQPEASKSAREAQEDKDAEKKTEQKPQSQQTPSEESEAEIEEDIDTGPPIPLTLIGGVDLLGELGALPGAGLGADLTAGLELGALRLEVVASIWLRRQTHLDNPSEFGAKLSLWSVAPGACYRLGERVVAVAPCIHVEIGKMSGEGTGMTDSYNGYALWLAPLAGVRFSWPMEDWYEFGLEVGCAFAVLRPDFTLKIVESPTREVVHKPSALAPRARLGGFLRF